MVCKKEVKWNKEREERIYGSYGKGSRNTQMRKQRSARELERKLQKQSHDLGMISVVNIQERLE